MIRKKICMVGSFAVGKTSLVARYVHSLFSETYQTTIGVKVDKKTVDIGGDEVTLVLWDLAGEDDLMPIQLSYLRGARRRCCEPTAIRGSSCRRQKPRSCRSCTSS